MLLKDFLKEIQDYIDKGEITLNSEVACTSSCEEYDDLFTFEPDIGVAELPTKDKYLRIDLN